MILCVVLFRLFVNVCFGFVVYGSVMLAGACAMLCCVDVCGVVLCCCAVAVRFAVLCDVVLCCAVLCYVVLCCAAPCYVVLLWCCVGLPWVVM